MAAPLKKNVQKWEKAAAHGGDAESVSRKLAETTLLPPYAGHGRTA